MKEQVTLRDIQLIWARILQKLETYKSPFDISGFDMYWQVLASSAYDVTKEPQVGVGSLPDDLEHLFQMSNNDEVPVTSVDIDRFAAILHAISQVMAPVEEERIVGPDAGTGYASGI